ncbi:MAG TPA: lysylphosphatidylglycerol synthase transmembrane domain-containing protein, partial [Candidatus Thermoplasmatota archaeon]|nr:lysylphosphatidylglycerol synthase transmembrane domain-containing protein [Candidatus Thermoplasmatota archaeon]
MVSPRTKAGLAFAAGLVFLGALVAYVGPATVARALASANLPLLAFAAGVYALFFLLRGIRWRTLLSRSAPDVRVSSTTSITAVGWLANSILPLKGGDVLRAALVARRESLALGPSAATVALERVLDLVGLAAVAALGLLLIPAHGDLPEWLGRAMEVAWVVPLLALACLALLVWLRAPAMRLCAAVCRPLGKPGAKLHGFVDTTVSGLDALARRPRLLAVLLPLTLVVAAAQALIFALIVMAFIPGTPFGLAYGGSAMFLLSFVVSVTPGNVGTYEAAFVAVFVALGTPTDIAVPAAILTHLTTTFIVAVLGSLGMLALSLEPARRLEA